MAEKRWCVITGLGKKSIFGFLPNHEDVVFKKEQEGLAGVQRGDIVEFVAHEFLGGDGTGKRRIKWFGNFPIIIARNTEETKRTNPVTRAAQNYKGKNPRLEIPRIPDTRQRPTNACEWKEQHENALDAQSLREVRAGATSSGAGTT